MRVLIDAHMIGERETGNETYIVNLIRGLRSLNADLDLRVAVTHLPEADAALGGFDNRCQPVRISSSPWRRLGSQLNQLIRTHAVDLLHVTYAGPWRPACPMVVTIHDVSFKANPVWFSWRDRLILNSGVGITVRRADRVITVSEHARQEIIRHYPVAAEKTDVTHEASARHFHRLDDAGRDHPLIINGQRIETPYVLAVGNLQPRKNLRRLIEAFALAVRGADTPHRLVIAGKALWRESEAYRAAETAGIASRILFTGYVSNEDLNRLFNRADLFAYPSLYEGFGLPVLEAMTCGTPVITSNTTSIPEVAGDAAIMIDPTDTSALAAALQDMMTNAARRKELSAKGLARASSFSWESCARETLQTYRRATRTVTPTIA